MPDLESELHRLAAEFRTTLRRLHIASQRPHLRKDHIMAAIDEFKALEPRLDAIAAAIGTDTATAVANAVAPLNEQITTLQAAATQTETDAVTEAGVLAGKVSTIETGLGIAQPALVVDPNAPTT